MAISNTMNNSLGVIGAGYISQFHFRAFAALKACVRVVADVNHSAAQQAAAPFGAEVTGDWRRVVDDPHVSAVVILTGSGSHFEMAKAALECGKHVVSEKTLTLCAKQSIELGRLAEAKKRVLYTSYMKRFFPAVQKAKELMPRLGRLMSVYCRTYQGVGDDFHSGKLPAWVCPSGGNPSPILSKSGGGILVCGGSHVFDLLLHLAGKPRSVYARSFRRAESDVDLMTHAMFDLESGGVGHFEGNWHPLRKIGYQQRGWDEGFIISGVNGQIVLETPVWNEPEHNAATLRYYDNTSESWTEYALPIVDPFVEAERFFLGNIACGEQGAQDPYTGYRTDLLLEKTQQSADEGTPVEITWEA